MKITYFSAAAILAVACTVTAKPIPDDSTPTNTVPISWRDVESGSQNAQRANQGQADKGRVDHDLHAREPKDKPKNIENANPFDDGGDHSNDPSWGAQDPASSGTGASEVNTGLRNHNGDAKKDTQNVDNAEAMNEKRDGVKFEARGSGGRPYSNGRPASGSRPPQKRDPTANTGAEATINTAIKAGPCEGPGSGCVGDVTHWDGGLGACGWNVNANSDMQIALPVGLMGAQSNGNPYCGRAVTIKNPTTGVTVSATVGDKCMGCVGNSIDLTNALFAAVAPGCDRRCTGFQWWFN